MKTTGAGPGFCLVSMDCLIYSDLSDLGIAANFYLPPLKGSFYLLHFSFLILLVLS